MEELFYNASVAFGAVVTGPVLSLEDLFYNASVAVANFVAQAISNLGGYLNTLLIASYKPIVPAAAVTSVGVSLTALFFCLEMFSQVAQFRVERIEDAIRIAMKFIVAKIIIENTAGISDGIYKIFRIATLGGVDSACKQIGTILKQVMIDPKSGGMLGIGYIILFLGLGGIAVVMLVMFFKLAITFVGISFEIGIHQAVAPIALSTLCNDLARPTGIAFIKSYAAACLQMVVMAAIFSVFGETLGVLSNINLGAFSQYTMTNPDGTLTNYSLGIFSVLIQYIAPLICTIALSKAIKIASDLTKRMFGA